MKGERVGAGKPGEPLRSVRGERKDTFVGIDHLIAAIDGKGDHGNGTRGWAGWGRGINDGREGGRGGRRRRRRRLHLRRPLRAAQEARAARVGGGDEQREERV